MATDASAPSPYDSLAGVPLQVQVVSLGHATLVVRVHGDVDLSTAALLREQLAGNLRHGHEYVLNLTAVGFFGTTGLRLLAGWQRAVAMLGSHAALVLTDGAVKKALALLDFADPLPRFDTEAEAVDHVGSLGAQPPGPPIILR